jgi:hypothetical protein
MQAHPKFVAATALLPITQPQRLQESSAVDRHNPRPAALPYWLSPHYWPCQLCLPLQLATLHW